MTDSKPKRRWFYPTPGWLVLCSLLLTGLFFVSERFKWFAFNHHKGWTVLITVASVIGMVGFMLLWWLSALLFRRRFQFSVRSLLLLALALALPCGWLAGDMKKAREQKKAAQEIERTWGHFGLRSTIQGDKTVTTFPNVYYDWRLALGSNWNANCQPPGAPCLRNVLGEDFFTDVVMVSTLGMKNADTELETLRALKALQQLNLDGADVTDVGLKHLMGLTTLKGLSLSYTRISGAGLENLKHLTTLQELHLCGTQVTDTGLENLERFTALHLLRLSGTKVTDAGVAKLQQALPNCKIER